MSDITPVVGGARKPDITTQLGGARISPTVQGFSDFYESYHGISEHRAQQRRRLLGMFEESLPHPIGQLSPGDVQRFLASRDVAPATTLRELKMMRPWFRWLWTEGHITADQYMLLREVKPPRGAGETRPRPYTRRQIAEFWEDFDAAYPWTRERGPAHESRLDHQTPRRGEYWARRFELGISRWDRVRPYARRLQAEAVVALVLYGGIRARETFDLELVDMHYENAYVRVMSARKNVERESYERAVPMTETMAVALANWIEFREQVLKPQHDRPWLNLWYPDSFLEPQAFPAFRETLARVGPGFEMHRMRHTFGTERLRAGMPIETLQKIMGHSTIQQTLRYAQVSNDDVVRVAKKTNDKFAAVVTRQHEIMR